MLSYLAIETWLAVCSDNAASIMNGSKWYNALAFAVGYAFILWTVVGILLDLLGRSSVSFEMFVMCIGGGFALQIDSKAKLFFWKEGLMP